MTTTFHDPYFPLPPGWAGQSRVNAPRKEFIKWVEDSFPTGGGYRFLWYGKNTTPAIQIRDERDWVLFTLRWL